jgi:hypothetical protein
MRTIDISNSDNVIDSREVIAKLEALSEERGDLQQAIDDAKESLDEEEGDEKEAMQEDYDAAVDALESWDIDNKAELDALQALNDDAEGYAEDWRHGATLVKENYFPEYCKELLDDIGDLPRDLPDYIVIDWDATAENLKADYTEVDFDGEAYLVR